MEHKIHRGNTPFLSWVSLLEQPVSRKPLSVPMIHGLLVSNAIGMISIIDETDHVLIPGALIHSHFLYGAISILYLGGTIYLMEKFSPTTCTGLHRKLPDNNALCRTYNGRSDALRKHISFDKPIQIISSGAKWEVNSKQKIQEQFLHVNDV